VRATAIVSALFHRARHLEASWTIVNVVIVVVMVVEFRVDDDMEVDVTL
jgi:hypothetical protein